MDMTGEETVATERTDGPQVRSPTSGNSPESPFREVGPRRALSSPYLHRKQRQHFILYDVLPLVGTIAAIVLSFRVPVTALDMALLFGMWALTGLGLSVGFHRLFCHRAFKAATPVRVLLVVCGCMAARSSMITWASQHRRHHQLADHEGDVHSPNLHGSDLRGRLHGWVYSHFLWMWKHEYPNVAYYGRDLLADRPAARADRYYQTWILIGLALPALLGGVISMSWMGALTGFLWGGVMRLFIVAQQISALNSLNHMFGTRPFKMKDNNSHNNGLFGWLTWGEGWHNNHHALPDCANFGFRWYQVDPGYWLIRVLEISALAWDVRRPSSTRIDNVQARLRAGTPISYDIYCE